MDQAFHVSVMALNYWHSDGKFIPLDSIATIPNDAQRRALDNLRRLFKAFASSPQPFNVPASGRRTTPLISFLTDLSEFATWEGAGGDAYTKTFPEDPNGLQGKIGVPRDVERAEELRPYRALDPSRLKLFGQASWDIEPYLSDHLWMAFVEPARLVWTTSLNKEKCKSVLDLGLLGDVNGLLQLKQVSEECQVKDPAMRFFNAYKNQEIDRMIGDRRSWNYREGRLAGVSSGLPTPQCLFDLEIDP